MRYWWVNQSQTYRHEVAGGYLWSPKRKSDGSRNPFYEFMREVGPGDLVFSFANARIRAFGVATYYAYEAPKPPEFGAVGRNWDQIGWRVDVAFRELRTTLRPADWIDVLRPRLPNRYSPLRSNGHGVQSMYLTELPESLALTIADLMGTDVGALARSQIIAERTILSSSQEIVLWEEHLLRTIEQDAGVETTERQALVLARRGQGLFRSRVEARESRCRITGVTRPEHLRASHIRPWRDCNNADRLDGENGLLLTPSIDHLFDRGFISFRDDGRVLVSPVAHAESLRRMGVNVDREMDVGGFSFGQRGFLAFHRDAVFLQSQTRR